MGFSPKLRSPPHVLSAVMVLFLAAGGIAPLHTTANAQLSAPNESVLVQAKKHYTNETVSLSLAMANTPTSTKGAPALNSRMIPQPLRGYFNETLSLSFEKIDSAAAGLEIRLVIWPEVKTLLLAGKILLIDTRAAADYQARHIPGAISIPVETSDADMQVAMSLYPKNQPITVYCASASCSASRSFAERLINFGFTNVRDMAGGFAEYLQAGTETPGTK